MQVCFIDLNVNLIVVENLTLKSLHHYHVKFCKNSPDVSTVEFTCKDPLSLLSRLHLRLFLHNIRSRNCKLVLHDVCHSISHLVTPTRTTPTKKSKFSNNCIKFAQIGAMRPTA
jgi:hypothetical protein